MRKPILPLLLALLLLGLPAHAEDDGEAGRDYARSLLLKQAHRAVGGHGTSRDALAAMQRGLAADMAFAQSVNPESDGEHGFLKAFQLTIQERVLLVGRPASGEGEEAVAATEGALQESVELRDWLLGQTGCAISVTTSGKGKVVEHAYPYPPEPPKVEPAATARPDGGAEERPDEAPSGEAAPAKGKDGEGATPDPGEAGGSGKDGVPAPAPKAEPKPAPEAAAPMDVDAWAKKVVRVGEGGSLRGRTLTAGVCESIDSLLLANAAQPVYVHPEAHGLTRHAMLLDGHFEYNKPFAAVRLLQADERNKAMQSDQPPPSLVDGAMVREKSRETARFREQLDERKAQRKRVVERLDQMVDDLDGWKTQAALLAREIEELKRAAPPPKTEAGGEDEQVEAPRRTQVELDLRLAQARETLASIEITLLYLTAVRGGIRLELLDQLLRACAEETTAAEQVHLRYESALQRLRSARRLDRLNSDERMLGKWIRDGEESKPADGSRSALRLRAYRAVKEVNGVVQEAVVRRRAMESGGAEEETDRGPPAAGGSEDEAKDEAETSLLSSVIMAASTANWDVKYLEIARRELLDPTLRSAFGATLVAEHYAAVDERIRALVEAFRIAKDEGRLRRDFDEALSGAKAALEPLQYDPVVTSVRNLPTMVEAASGDFDAAEAGIIEQREKNEERLDALLGYRALLLRQGTRSLLIRVDRGLSSTNVGDVLQDTSRAFDAAGDWVLIDGEHNVSNWLGSTWLRILILLALLVGVFFLAHLGRRFVDRWIEGRVATYPTLQTHGASVREERERARERREADATAAEMMSVESVLQQEGPVEPGEEEGAPSENAPSEDGPARPGRAQGIEAEGGKA